jgi:hypothetical protein
MTSVAKMVGMKAGWSEYWKVGHLVGQMVDPMGTMMVV